MSTGFYFPSCKELIVITINIYELAFFPPVNLHDFDLMIVEETGIVVCCKEKTLFLSHPSEDYCGS